MVDLSPSQRQMLVDGLNRIIRESPIPGSAPILPPSWAPYPSQPPPQLHGLPPAVVTAIAPNLGVNRGKGDFVTNRAMPLTSVPDPMMDIRPGYPGDQRLEMRDRPWDNDLLLRNT